MKKIIVFLSLLTISLSTMAKSKRYDLMRARITHGGIAIGAGHADIFVMVNDGGDIESLNIEGRLGFLFWKEDVSRVVDINNLVKQEPFPFRITPKSKPILKIVPSQEFTVEGGPAILQIWDGEEYSSEKVVFEKLTTGGYKGVHIDKKGKQEEIGEIRINMRGTDPNRMYVRRYQIEKKD